ncbi:MAG: cell division protein FtsQ, partial [Nitrospinae bacterium]|nr:cell division protein FtsQ [Nitrospinota bacterium]
KLALIDREGEVILRDGVEKFARLPLLVGAQAPAAAAEIIDQIAMVAGLADIVEAAIHVSGRRWNLRLKGDIEVRLPEEGVAGALIRLGKLRQRDGLLERNVIAVDLRQPDRLIVKQVPPLQPPDKRI